MQHYKLTMPFRAAEKIGGLCFFSRLVMLHLQLAISQEGTLKCVHACVPYYNVTA